MNTGRIPKQILSYQPRRQGSTNQINHMSNNETGGKYDCNRPHGLILDKKKKKMSFNLVFHLLLIINEQKSWK
jgi:hypothetical protein